jgi:hypothetical protein
VVVLLEVRALELLVELLDVVCCACELLVRGVL